MGNCLAKSKNFLEIYAGALNSFLGYRRSRCRPREYQPYRKFLPRANKKNSVYLRAGANGRSQPPFPARENSSELNVAAPLSPSRQPSAQTRGVTEMLHASFMPNRVHRRFGDHGIVKSEVLVDGNTNDVSNDYIRNSVELQIVYAESNSNLVADGSQLQSVFQNVASSKPAILDEGIERYL